MIIKVLTAQTCPTGGGLRRYPPHDGKERDIEGSTTEIVNGNHRRVGAVEAISQGGRGGLIDHTENVEASDSTSILGSLTLGIVEVSGYGDDSMAKRKGFVSKRKKKKNCQFANVATHLIFFPVYCSAVCFILVNTIDESCSADCGRSKNA